MKATDALREAGEKIINEMRTELYLSLPFMGPAMDALPCIPDRTTLTLGTDAQYLRYNPRFLIDTYLLDPDSLPRVYMCFCTACSVICTGCRRTETSFCGTCPAT